MNRKKKNKKVTGRRQERRQERKVTSEMKKQEWKPGNMIYPVPAVMVTVSDQQGNDNIITVAWTGTVCTNPPMAYISVRPERYSYHMIKETGEFVINLTTKELAYATDYCGVKSGRDVDKAKAIGFTPVFDDKAPYFEQAKMVLICKKLYSQYLAPELFADNSIEQNYPLKDL